MYTFNNLLNLHNNINNNNLNYYKDNYILDTDCIIDENNIIIYHIYDNMNRLESKNKLLYIFTPILFMCTFILGFKQFIYMIY